MWYKLQLQVEDYSHQHPARPRSSCPLPAWMEPGFKARPPFCGLLLISTTLSQLEAPLMNFVNQTFRNRDLINKRCLFGFVRTVAWETQIQEALELCSTRQNGVAYKAKDSKIMSILFAKKQSTQGRCNVVVIVDDMILHIENPSDSTQMCVLSTYCCCCWSC